MRVSDNDEELRFSAVDVERFHGERADVELRLSLRPEDLTQHAISTLREILTRYPDLRRWWLIRVPPEKPFDWVPHSTSTSRVSLRIFAQNSAETS